MKTLLLLPLVGILTMLGLPGDEAEKQLTYPEVKALLKKTGYDVTDSTNISATVTIKGSGFTVPATVSLSSNGKWLYLESNFGQLAASDLTDGAFLEGVLEGNKSTQPSAYNIVSFGKSPDITKYLYFDDPVQNRGITADSMKKLLDDYLATVSGQASVWTYPSKKKPAGK